MTKIYLNTLILNNKINYKYYETNLKYNNYNKPCIISNNQQFNLIENFALIKYKDININIYEEAKLSNIELHNKILKLNSKINNFDEDFKKII
jgi:hypothetical protein